MNTNIITPAELALLTSPQQAITTPHTDIEIQYQTELDRLSLVNFMSNTCLMVLICLIAIGALIQEPLFLTLTLATLAPTILFLWWNFTLFLNIYDLGNYFSEDVPKSSFFDFTTENVKRIIRLNIEKSKL